MFPRIFVLSLVTGIAIGAFIVHQKVESLTRENATLRQLIEGDDVARESIHPNSVVSDATEALQIEIGVSRFPEQPTSTSDGAKHGSAKVPGIEKQLKLMRDTAMAYLMMIDALKSEVNIKEGELQELRSYMTKYQFENRVLQDSLARKESAPRMALRVMDSSQNEITLEKNLDIDYYAAAQRVEAAARRILFSPVRKKEYLREALEVYKKAYSLGRKEAAGNIVELENLLFPDSSATAKK